MSHQEKGTGMGSSPFGRRTKYRMANPDLVSGLSLAKQKFREGAFLEAFDLYEQLAASFPPRSVSVLAELYDRYKELPQRDRYHLYQARTFDFGILPGDKVLDVGSGHIPFPLATHLSDVTLKDHAFGRAGAPFKHVDGKPVYEFGVEDIPFADKEFDFVYCSHVLEHASDPGKACRELMRVARRGYIETPTKGKDIFLDSAQISNHAWDVASFDGRLIFTPYTQDEVEAFQCDILQLMHGAPQTDREKAFSALIYLKAPVVNTMFLWEGEFAYEVRRFGRPTSIFVPAAAPEPARADAEAAAPVSAEAAAARIDAWLASPRKSSESLLDLAEWLFEGERVDDSERICRLMLERFGKSADVLNLLGAILYRRERYAEAKEALSEACAFEPGNRAAAANLAEALLALGDTPDGVAATPPPSATPALGGANLRFLQIHTFYLEYLKALYESEPHLAQASFRVQMDRLVADGFSGIHMFAPYMGNLGYDAELIVANNPWSQQQWLNENRITLADMQDWVHDVVRHQIDTLRPDVLYLSDPITFDGRFLRTLSWKPSLVLGWRAANIPADTDWTGFDVMLSSLAALRETALKIGARAAEHFFPGYPGWVNGKISGSRPEFDVVFSGMWTLDQHPGRNRYLQEVAKAASDPRKPFTLGYYLSGQVETITPDVARFNLGGRFGVSMHQALRSGKIVIDARGILETRDNSGNTVDLARRETANMRIFEATGAGVFLLTEHFDNLSAYFTPGVEVETFRDGKELVEKIRYYLAHPEEREAIARRGQERCLREYGIEARAAVLDAIVRKHLEARSSAPEPAVLPVIRMMQDAIESIEEGDLAKAFDLLIHAKSLRQPVMGLDQLRAIVFTRMNRTGEARDALLEELRHFPDNLDAKGDLDSLLKSHPEAVSPIAGEGEFRELLGVIRPYTMLSVERLWNLFRMAKEVCEKNLPGNFVECGVAAGGSSALLAYVIKRYSRIPRFLYSFDSFSGMPSPTEEDRHGGVDADQTGWGTGTCSAPEESVREVCARVGAGDVVRTVKGFFEETLPVFRDRVGMIALLHLDGDWYESTRAILANLYDRIVDGGLLQVDDYGYWEGCRKAFHEFEAARGYTFEVNPIDDTGIWLVKPNSFEVNPVLQKTLVHRFLEDDPIPKGIEGQMSRNERFQLYYAATELLPRKSYPLRFVEVGSYAGGSLLLAYKALKRVSQGLQGFCVEPGGRPQLAEVLRKIGSEVTHLPCFSFDAAPELRKLFEQDGNFPEFIFIDGDHGYEGVRRDILDYYPLLAADGLLLFHDFLPPLDDENREAIFFHHGGTEPGIRRACVEVMEQQYGLKPIDLPLLCPADPTQTQAHLPIIPGVYSTVRAYRKPRR
ncbi:MAG TPA: TylF/MycF/NovP-related O-methyltransferase [Candidatus Deferrimicrobiaceae bacterium]|jgi:hypothetical protein